MTKEREEIMANKTKWNAKTTSKFIVMLITLFIFVCTIIGSFL